MATDESRTRGGTLESGLDIIECLVERPDGAGVTELAVLLGMDKGNLHRLLKVLIARGYVTQQVDSRRYRATAHVVGLAGSLLRQLDLRSVGEQPCAQLLERTGESVHLSQVTRSGVVYILQRRAPFRVSIATEVGARPPLHATATGKSILAHVDDAMADEWLSEPFESFTYRTHTDRASLDRDLELIRSRGFAVDDEEYNPGARCVAAPIFGLEGTVVGCVGMSTPTQRVSIGDLSKLAGEVLRTARQITANMGGPVDRHPDSDPWIEDGGIR
ncbi:IclR family transcriptional regulator [Solicola sp. PLA-1-18]|uniref:IclR family transcriptional regulator n=1 Tax=Solicola sp. PLA-1-18 TaxID=3380532 RepID=UPI003B7FC84D